MVSAGVQLGWLYLNVIDICYIFKSNNFIINFCNYTHTCTHQTPHKPPCTHTCTPTHHTHAQTHTTHATNHTMLSTQPPPYHTHHITHTTISHTPPYHTHHHITHTPPYHTCTNIRNSGTEERIWRPCTWSQRGRSKPTGVWWANFDGRKSTHWSADGDQQGSVAGRHGPLRLPEASLRHQDPVGRVLTITPPKVNRKT